MLQKWHDHSLVSRFTFCMCLLSSPLTPFSRALQVLWSSRRLRRAPTATGSTPSPSLRTARPSSPDRATRRSKCGTQVTEKSPPNGRLVRLSHSLALVCRHARAQDGEDERTQQRNQLRRLRSRRKDHRLRLMGQDDQSLGRRCRH